MKHPIVGRGVPSALFIFSTKEGKYDLARGTNSSNELVQRIVEAVSKTMLTTTWIYLDGFIYRGYDKSNDPRTLNLFDAPVKESLISGFTDEMRSSPETFFTENEPGLVVAPFAAINLGEGIEVVIVVRDRKTQVTSDDVMRSLRFFVEGEDGDSPILLPATVKRMAERIGASTGSSPIKVGGSRMYVSLGFKVGEPALVTPKPERKPFTIKRKAAPRNAPPESQSPPWALPFWQPPTGE